MRVKFRTSSLLVLLFLVTLAESKYRSSSSSSSYGSSSYRSGYRSNSYRSSYGRTHGSSIGSSGRLSSAALTIIIIVTVLVVIMIIACLCNKKRGSSSGVVHSQNEGMNLSNVQQPDGLSNPMQYPPNQFPVAQPYADPSNPNAAPPQGFNVQQTADNPSYPQSNTPFITPQSQGSKIQQTAEQTSSSNSYLPQGGNNGNDIPETPPPAYQTLDPPMYPPGNQTPPKPGPPY